MAAVDSGSATGQSDEALVEAFLTAFVGGDAEAVADLVTEDCVLHEPRWPITRTGRSAIVDATGDNEGTFTDLDIRVERSVSADGEIAAYVTASGRNVGP
ncbi:nuclear transport factor 2 family protein, partial [Halomicroarcula sp. GCM10025710]